MVYSPLRFGGSGSDASDSPPLNGFGGKLTDDDLVDDLAEVKLALDDCLESICGTGSFSADGRLDDINPGLRIDGLGTFGMPLSEAEIHRIVQHSRQAPFGKGEDTIVDTSVRRTWEIDTSKLGLSHPKWPAKHKSILEQACNALGIPRGAESVEAHLYKLLVYEPGAMFKPHKDTEKEPRMFGTLVICLPSEHEGGDLVLSFNGRTQSLSSSTDSTWSGSFFAWYADVLHEIKPVTSGHRVVLTYNLVHNGPSATPGLNNQGAQYKALKSALSRWDAEDQSLPDHLVYMLEHEYTELNLTLGHLKASDRERASALANAASEAGFEVFLCNIERKVSGSAEDDGEYWGYNSGPGRSRGDDKHDLIDISEDSLRLTKAVRLDGSSFLKNVKIRPADIVQTDPFEGKDIDDEDYEGWTGNEGAYATQWYRSAGLLILPQSRVLDFQLDKNGSVVSTLAGQTSRLRSDAENSAQRSLVVRVIEMAIRKGKMHSGNFDAASTILNACVVAGRQDLLVKA